MKKKRRVATLGRRKAVKVGVAALHELLERAAGMVDLTAVATQLTRDEGLRQSISVAQVTEVLGCLGGSSSWRCVTMAASTPVRRRMARRAVVAALFATAVLLSGCEREVPARPASQAEATARCASYGGVREIEERLTHCRCIDGAVMEPTEDCATLCQQHGGGSETCFQHRTGVVTCGDGSIYQLLSCGDSPGADYPRARE